MRGATLSVLPMIACLAAGSALAHEATADRETLRKAWHRCVRQEFSGQPVAVEQRAAERAALRSCKAQEDAYVAAELAARQSEGDAEKPGPASRARSWIAAVGSSVAAYVVDPIASWFHGFGR